MAENNWIWIKILNQPMIKLFSKFCEMTECKPARAFLQSGLDLRVDESDVLNDGTPYRQLIGSLLLYLILLPRFQLFGSVCVLVCSMPSKEGLEVIKAHAMVLKRNFELCFFVFKRRGALLFRFLQTPTRFKSVSKEK